MANNPNDPPKKEAMNPATQPTPVTDKIVSAAEADPNREAVKAARKQIEHLIVQRTTAVNSMKTAIEQAKMMEQQSFVYRGRITVYDELIDDLRRKHGIKETVQ